MCGGDETGRGREAWEGRATVSAKGRKPKTAVTGSEFYPTPSDAILPLLTSPLVSLPGGRWIEPAAGTGRIVATVNSLRDDVQWTLCEIDERVGQFLEPLLRPGDELLPYGDFLAPTWDRPVADVAILNPPFKLTMGFVLACMARARTVVMLQRCGWCGTQARAPWLREHAPDVFRLPTRPSFTPDGATDSTEYDWFVWPAGGHDRREGRFAILDAGGGRNRSLDWTRDRGAHDAVTRHVRTDEQIALFAGGS